TAFHLKGGPLVNYVGIDYHKRYSVVTAIDPSGAVIQSGRLDNRPEPFQAFFDGLDGPSEVVLEASRTWGVLYDLVEDMDGVDAVTLAHPYKVRAIADAQIKTDKIDSHILAQLLRVNLIPEAYVPGKQTRLCRDMVRQRMFLVRLRTRVKNRLTVLLDRLHVPLPVVSDLFGKAGINYLKGLQLSGINGEVLRENMELLEMLNKLVKQAEKEIELSIGRDRRVELLRTIPGFGPILAAVTALEIDAIERFHHPSKLAAYIGLVPTTSASGGKTYHGRLLPMCNKWLRWALIEATWTAARYSPYCRSLYDSKKRHKGVHTAAVALARRLCEIVWHVLKEDRPYEERPFRTFHDKSSPAALRRG
ncbi:MAG: IS110 family transposase, partial [Betaproteobacteria bacterium]